MLGVFEDAAAVPVRAGVFALRLHIGAADLDGLQFIFADAPVEDFLLAGLGVKEPLAAGKTRQRHGERIVVFADVDHRRVAILLFQLKMFTGTLHELVVGLLILDLVAGDEILDGRTEEMVQGGVVVGVEAILADARFAGGAGGDVIHNWRVAAARERDEGQSDPAREGGHGKSEDSRKLWRMHGVTPNKFHRRRPAEACPRWLCARAAAAGAARNALPGIARGAAMRSGGRATGSGRGAIGRCTIGAGRAAGGAGRARWSKRCTSPRF